MKIKSKIIQLLIFFMVPALFSGVKCAESRPGYSGEEYVPRTQRLFEEQGFRFKEIIFRDIKDEEETINGRSFDLTGDIKVCSDPFIGKKGDQIIILYCVEVTEGEVQFTILNENRTEWSHCKKFPTFSSRYQMYTGCTTPPLLRKNEKLSLALSNVYSINPSEITIKEVKIGTKVM